MSKPLICSPSEQILDKSRAKYFTTSLYVSSSESSSFEEEEEFTEESHEKEIDAKCSRKDSVVHETIKPQYTLVIDKEDQINKIKYHAEQIAIDLKMDVPEDIIHKVKKKVEEMPGKNRFGFVEQKNKAYSCTVTMKQE